MTLATPELLMGCFAALSAPPPPESSGEFMAGTVGAVALIVLLAAQETETAAAVRNAENGLIRALFRDVLADGSAEDLRAHLTACVAQDDGDLSITALDAANARLRTALIELHIHAEIAGLRSLEGRILRLLCDGAQRRELVLPS